jgi:hypothetical protein
LFLSVGLGWAYHIMFNLICYDIHLSVLYVVLCFFKSPVLPRDWRAPATLETILAQLALTLLVKSINSVHFCVNKSQTLF